MKYTNLLSEEFDYSYIYDVSSHENLFVGFTDARTWSLTACVCALCEFMNSFSTEKSFFFYTLLNIILFIVKWINMPMTRKLVCNLNGFSQKLASIWILHLLYIVIRKSCVKYFNILFFWNWQKGNHEKINIKRAIEVRKIWFNA